MKKSILLSLIALFFAPLMTFAATITVDNDFSDWANVPSLATGTENITGTNYWLVDGAWTTTEPAVDTLVINQEKMMDILDFRLTNDDTNMCVMMQAVYPFMMAKNETTNAFYPFGYPLTFDPATGQPLTFVPGAPADFNHDMVLSFDTNNDDKFDYYGATNFSWSVGSSGKNAMTVVRTIYQDDGDGIYTPATDTVISSVTNPEGSVSAAVILDAGQTLTENRMETCQPMGDAGLFFLNVGDTVKVRLETHSDIGDYTATVAYTVEGNVINQDAYIVGTGKAGSKFGTGVITAYDIEGNALLTINAYDKKVGAKVAVGDIYEDNQPEIITIPLKKSKRPELKFYTANGTLGNEFQISSKYVKKSTSWDMAVNDVNNDNINEIILTSAKNNKVTFLIYQLSEAKGKLVKLADVVKDTDGYTNGAWVAVANVDAADDTLEIITAPRVGDARFDIWNYNYAKDIEFVANASFGTNETYNQGMNIAARGKKIYSYMQVSNGMINDYTYDTTNLIEPGTYNIADIGRIGEMSSAGDYLAVSARSKRKVFLYDTDGNKANTLAVNSKGAPVDYFKLAQ